WLVAITALVRPLLAPLTAASATVDDALDVAVALVALFTAVAASGDVPSAAAIRLTLDGGDLPSSDGAFLAGGLAGLFEPGPPPSSDTEVPSIPDDAPAPGGGRPPTAEELARLAASGVRTTVGGADEAGGAFVTSLLGKLIDAR